MPAIQPIEKWLQDFGAYFQGSFQVLQVPDLALEPAVLNLQSFPLESIFIGLIRQYLLVEGITASVANQ